jgi:hypothetical protein
MKTIMCEMLLALAQSADRLKAQISNPRYGKPGFILFDLRGETYEAAEPTDELPLAGTKEQAISWCLKALLHKRAKLIN